MHRVGNEAAWWQDPGIDPIKAARKLWQRTRLDEGGLGPIGCKRLGPGQIRYSMRRRRPDLNHRLLGRDRAHAQAVTGEFA